MALRAIPARGGWVWTWLTPAWAATVRPTISAVAAMLSIAVIQRRARRVIVTSLIRLRPVVRDHRWFGAAAPADGYRPPATATRARGSPHRLHTFCIAPLPGRRIGARSACSEARQRPLLSRGQPSLPETGQ